MKRVEVRGCAYGKVADGNGTRVSERRGKCVMGTGYSRKEVSEEATDQG
jgi:hypothetical protein